MASPSKPAAAAEPNESSKAPREAAAPAAAAPPTTTGPVSKSKLRTRVLAVGAVVIVALATYYGWPELRLLLNTVSTDDAYVNGHVTFV
ncbi:MAG: hypothetical protein AB7G28_19765, partial [Pirellulales bacterium]